MVMVQMEVEKEKEEEGEHERSINGAQTWAWHIFEIFFFLSFFSHTSIFSFKKKAGRCSYSYSYSCFGSSHGGITILITWPPLNILFFFFKFFFFIFPVYR